MVKSLDCGILVSEFELQLHYYIHFRVNTHGKGMNPLILPAIGQIVPLLFFYPKMVDMPLNNLRSMLFSFLWLIADQPLWVI